MHLGAIEKQPDILQSMEIPADFRIAGWVYVLSNEFMPGIYKIGMTTTSPAKRGDFASPEQYPWDSNADYWMVTGLYSMMRANNLSEGELRAKCRSELRKMSDRIQSGESIPEPRKQLLKLSIPSSSEKAQEGVAMLRAALKRGKS